MSTEKNQFDNNGNRTGYWESFYNNDNLSSKGNFEKGQMTGYWELYHVNGNLESHGNCNNNISVGLWKRYDQNGKLKIKEFYIIN